MTQLYKVRAKRQLSPADLLHVGNIYQKERLHRSKMRERQDLILFLAHLHAKAWNPLAPRAFNQVELRLTSLRQWVYDYRPALDFFFDVQQLGYSFSEDDNQLSILYPKDISLPVIEELELEFDPGERPDGIISKVYVQPVDLDSLERRLKEKRLHHLLAPVRWLATRPYPEVNFTFKPAGKLQLRDTSVWPVPAVETWPSWLREELFGPGIDIDSAYVQYIVSELRQLHKGRERIMQLAYPDLIEQLENKDEWRQKLCAEVLDLPWNDDNKSLIKKICMSLANGSRISPAILTGGRAYSITAELIIQSDVAIDPGRLERIGNRLQSIAKQYSNAKKQICAGALKLHPSLRNQKQVFGSYFRWEREARYQIWESIDRHGIMVHDGIDGVPDEYRERLPQIIQKIGIKASAAE